MHLPKSGYHRAGTQVYDVTAGRHVFWVEAADARGNMFAVNWKWTAS